jgi:hypothetical protein
MGMPEFPLRAHAEVIYHPDHYRDEDGEEIWDIVCGYFGWDKCATSGAKKSSSEQQ